MSVSRRNLRHAVFAVLISFLFIAGAKAAIENSPMHWSGDKTLWDRKSNRVELFGHAAVHQPGETLTAEYISLDLNTRLLHARCNCVYIASSSIIYGEEMYINLDTRTGSIVNGRVISDTFTLAGERINKLGASRFQTHNGEYTTCKDCAESWKFLGGDVDMEIEGYAYMKNVKSKVKDAPFFWMPYMIVPLKSKRQTGLLFPKFGFTTDGFRFVQPFFWAINQSSDMTIGLGSWGGRGTRAETEARYKLSNYSYGQINFDYLRDKKFLSYVSSRVPVEDVTVHRWGINVAQTQELPWKVTEKLKWLDVSDDFYPIDVGGVIPGANDAYLSSDLIFSHATNQVSTYVAGKRIRSVLKSAPDINHPDTSPLRFDNSTVQVFPAAVMTTNDKFLFGSRLAGGLTLGLTNFARSTGPYDRNEDDLPSNPLSPFRPGIDPIREATRVSVTPSLYTTLRPFDVISVVPWAEYRGFLYQFQDNIPNLSRGYLLTRTDFSTQIERIYERDDELYPRIKHLFRPNVTFNLIPYRTESERHPFIQQIQYARDHDFTGFNFDSYDIVPVDDPKNYSNYFVPLGKSLSYGITNQLIRRKGKVDSLTPGYQSIVELRSTQSLNLREFKKPQTDQKPFSILQNNLRFNFDPWSAGVDHTYVPYAPITPGHIRHTFSGSFAYTFENAYHQRILAFQRTIALAYSYNTVNTSNVSNVRTQIFYSVSDYIMPSVTLDYDLALKRWNSNQAALKFQSPSQCWSFDLGFKRWLNPTLEAPNKSPYETQVSFDFSLNLTGQGFGNVSQMAEQVATGQPQTPK